MPATSCCRAGQEYQLNYVVRDNFTGTSTYGSTGALIATTVFTFDFQPLAEDDTNSTPEDTPVSGSAQSNDTPSNDGGNVWSLVSAENGNLNGDVTMDANGNYTYTPNANFNGTDVFTYQVCDADGDCDRATVTITVTAVDDQPAAVNDTNTTAEDSPVSGSVQGNDTPSGDGGNAWSLVGTNGGAANGTVTMDASGNYTYTPNANFNGTDVFSYEVCDVDGDCATATVTITITPVDDQPVAVNDTNSTPEDSPVSGSAQGNDTPSGDGGNAWALVGANGGAANGTVTMDAAGNYTYTPNANFNGTDVFTYQVCDVDGDCATATVTITVKLVTCGFTTLSQGGWGNKASPLTTTFFSSRFPTGLYIGASGRSVQLTSVSAVKGFLPSSGTPARLTRNWVNPTSSQLKNT
ncbi:MAG: cadherin-like domain-containing protein, partial [Verrucomicrobiota bacterium]